jgi:hypothetical protein
MIIESLEQIKEDRLRRERLQMLRRRMGAFKQALHALPRTPDVITPNHADLSALEPFHSIIFDFPPEVVVTKDTFTGALDQWPDAAAEWRNSSVQQLFQLLHKPFDVSALSLATAFFRCRWCTEPITYPRILKHACLTTNHSKLDDEEDEFLHTNIWTTPWNHGGEQVSFDEEASTFARQIIKSCGQDPLTITMSDMDILDCRVECVRCAHRSRGRLIMGWKQAVCVSKVFTGNDATSNFLLPGKASP